MKKRIAVIVSILALAIASIGCTIDTEIERHTEGTAIGLLFPNDAGEIALVWKTTQQYCQSIEDASKYLSAVFIIVNGRDLDLPGEVWRGKTFYKHVSVTYKVIKVEGRIPYIHVKSIEIH